MKYRNFNLSLKINIPLTAIIVVVLLALGIFWSSMIEDIAIESIESESRVITQQLENSRKFMGKLQSSHNFDPILIKEAQKAVEGLTEPEEIIKEVRKTRFYNTIPIVASWIIGQDKAKDASYTFRVVKRQARNPLNEATPIEREMLEKIEKDGLKDYYIRDKETNSIRYMRPIVLGDNCLVCHGTPGVDNPDSVDGKDPIGLKMEGWKSGEIHGAFEIITDLTEMENALNKIVLHIIFIGLVVCIFAVLGFHFLTKKVLIAPITTIKQNLEEVSKGNLALQLSHNVPNDELGSMMSSVSSTIQKLRSVVGDVMNSSQQLSHSSEELVTSACQMSESSKEINDQVDQIAAASEEVTSIVSNVAAAAEQTSINITSATASVEELSANTETIAAATEEASSNMSGVNQNIEQIANETSGVAGTFQNVSGTMSSINDKTKESSQITMEANESSQKTLQAMTDLNDKAESIGKIVKLIANIADQTNMLALNATIEAASAGEVGKGFAVVAAEVKGLSKQTRDANDQVATEIESVQRGITEAFNNTENVYGIIQKLDEITNSISASIEEQSRSAVEVSAAMDAIADAGKNSNLNVMEATTGIGEIARSASEASIASTEAARNVAEGASGVKDIARSSNEVSGAVSEVNKNLQLIQGAIKDVNETIASSQGQAESLSQISGKLKEIVSFFKV